MSGRILGIGIAIVVLHSEVLSALGNVRSLLDIWVDDFANSCLLCRCFWKDETAAALLQVVGLKGFVAELLGVLVSLAGPNQREVEVQCLCVQLLITQARCFRSGCRCLFGWSDSSSSSSLILLLCGLLNCFKHLLILSVISGFIAVV